MYYIYIKYNNEHKIACQCIIEVQNVFCFCLGFFFNKMSCVNSGSFRGFDGFLFFC